MNFAEKFWKRVGFADAKGCLPWLGATFNRGYGLFTIDGKSIAAHAIQWEMVNDRPPRGKELHHKCENPGCVNPDHLEEVTRKEHKQKHLKSACLRGHAYIPENTYFFEASWGIRRQCKICQRLCVSRKRKK